MPRFIRLLSVLTLALSACSPADWAAVNAAGSTVGAAVDTFALVRAEQIAQARARASEAAAKGDVGGATEAVNEALAILATTTIEELQAVRAELRDVRAKCQVSAAAPSPAATVEAP